MMGSGISQGRVAPRSVDPPALSSRLCAGCSRTVLYQIERRSVRSVGATSSRAPATLAALMSVLLLASCDRAAGLAESKDTKKPAEAAVYATEEEPPAGNSIVGAIGGAGCRARPLREYAD